VPLNTPFKWQVSHLACICAPINGNPVFKWSNFARPLLPVSFCATLRGSAAAAGSEKADTTNAVTNATMLKADVNRIRLPLSGWLVLDALVVFMSIPCLNVLLHGSSNFLGV
jgi:hypothetical protein